VSEDPVTEERATAQERRAGEPPRGIGFVSMQRTETSKGERTETKFIGVAVLRLGRRFLQFFTLALVVLGFVASSASARATWEMDAGTNSTVAPGSTQTFMVEIRNGGDVILDGSAAPLRFRGTLPAGMRVTSVISAWDCSSTVPGSQAISCQSTGELVPLATSLANSFKLFTIQADVDANASGLVTGVFEVSGGGARPVSGAASTTITDDAPQFGVAAFDASVTDANGDPFSQAGGHPFAASTSIDFNTERNPEPLKGDLWPVEQVKDLTVDLPPGFFGDPSGLMQCTLGQLAISGGVAVKQECPSSSQVGVLRLRTNSVFRLTNGPIPVFNMVPPTDAPARLGFNALGVVVTIDVTVRTDGDYGLTAHLRNISEGLSLSGSTLTLWGVPADPAHDPERACPRNPPANAGGTLCRSDAPLTAFLRNPTSCPEPRVGLPTTLTVDSWVHPTVTRQQTIFSHDTPGYPFLPASWGVPLGTTGCALVPFDASFAARQETAAAGRPTGYAFDISLPQSDVPTSIGQADLKKAVVTFPLGVRLSASSTAGLQGCSPAQIQLHTNNEPSCPGGSKLGSVSVKVPALRDPLQGSVYLASPHDNPFDTLIALYIVARGSGVLLKLPGQVNLDPFTGQISATFDDNPQAPFSNLHLQFKDGDRAALANPVACGSYSTHADLTAWSGKTVALESPFTVSKDGEGGACQNGKFQPNFDAGTESNAAGSSSSFHVRLTRDDDDEDIRGLSIHVPPGLVGRIADVPQLCGNVDAAAGTCPEGSRIGSVTTGAGSGPTPFYITNGSAYLTGRYKGAPYGLSIVVPAVAGPFNLGNVVVRAAVRVDKHTSAVTIDSDPLPLLLQGVSLGVRDIRVVTDRPGFWINPTSCDEQQITGEVTSASGKTVNVSQRYQAAECGDLPTTPKMAPVAGAVGRTGRNASIPFSTRLTVPRGNANLRSVRVSLPTTINARLPVINRACTRAQFEAGRCEGARAGTAVARTPLLRDPLRGGVFFVRNGHPLPDLFVALRGDVEFDLIGRTSIPGGKHLATTFDAIPDVPVTSFDLSLVSGSHGPVGAATNLCSRRGRSAKARIDYVAQNGKTRHVEQRVKIRGCGHTARHRHRRHHRR
jgi:hypothetical protein